MKIRHTNGLDSNQTHFQILRIQPIGRHQLISGIDLWSEDGHIYGKNLYVGFVIENSLAKETNAGTKNTANFVLLNSSQNRQHTRQNVGKERHYGNRISNSQIREGLIQLIFVPTKQHTLMMKK